MIKDPYKTLGLARSASPEAIKKAYRQLARTYHPDACPGDALAENRFKDISAAYAVLGEPSRRARFDSGEIDPHGNPRTPRRASPQPARSPGSAGSAKSRFEQFFKNRAHKERAGIKARGADVTYTLEVTLAEAVVGVEKAVRVTGGKTLRVTLPPATESGQVLCLAGQGMAGLGGGTSGDARVEIRVAADATFVRSGLDIHSTVTVPLQTAVLGGPLETDTVHGRVALNIPQGANTGNRLRLKGRGVRHPDGRQGDQIVVLQVMLPERQDQSFRDFIRTWSAARTGGKAAKKTAAGRGEKMRAAEEG